jgi:hypothetical protein
MEESKATHPGSTQVPGDDTSQTLSVENTPAEILVTWEGPSDPANPKNWSAASKILNVGIVSAIGFLT